MGMQFKATLYFGVAPEDEMNDLIINYINDNFNGDVKDFEFWLKEEYDCKLIYSGRDCDYYDTETYSNYGIAVEECVYESINGEFKNFTFEFFRNHPVSWYDRINKIMKTLKVIRYKPGFNVVSSFEE